MVFRRLTLQPSKKSLCDGLCRVILDRGERARAHCGERDGAPSGATASPILRRPSAPLRALLRSHLLLPQARGAESFLCDGDNIAKVIAMRDPASEVDVQSALGLSRGIYADAPGDAAKQRGSTAVGSLALRHPWWICGRGWGGSTDPISGIAPNAPPPHAPPRPPLPPPPFPPTEGDEVAYMLRTKVGTTTAWLLESQIRWDVETRTRLVGQYVDFNQRYQEVSQAFDEYKVPFCLWPCLVCA